jgi:vacuolar-type H+-ATPase subunit H
MTTNGDTAPSQPEAQEPLEQLLGEVLDLVDETVAQITDDLIEERLRRILDQSGHSSRMPEPPSLEAPITSVGPVLKHELGQAKAPAISHAAVLRLAAEITASVRRAAGQAMADAREQSERIITEARQEAERTITETRAEAERIITEARQEAERTITETRAEAERIITEAGQEAGRTITTTRDVVEFIITEAGQEAGRTITTTRDEAMGIYEARMEVNFDCPKGHHFTVPFAAEAEVPATWECRICGALSFTSTGDLPEPKKVKPPRSHWDMLKERHSIADLERVLAERLALIRSERANVQDPPARDSGVA